VEDVRKDVCISLGNIELRRLVKFVDIAHGLLLNLILRTPLSVSSLDEIVADALDTGPQVDEQAHRVEKLDTKTHSDGRNVVIEDDSGESIGSVVAAVDGVVDDDGQDDDVDPHGH
jgi:hypothetical protein